jgi:hypothetical protein
MTPPARLQRQRRHVAKLYSQGACSSSWVGVQNWNMSELDRWDSFYVIVGSAAGALIGPQFVVITLIAERPPMRAEAGAAFATPSIVYFSTTLLLSALQRVPWPSINFAAALWGLIGLSGTAYAAIIARRMRVQRVYQPGFEDWLFHFLLPLGAYIMLGSSACAASTHDRCYLALPRRRCCCFSLAFTTPGTASSITCFPEGHDANGGPVRMVEAALAAGGRKSSPTLDDEIR